MSGDGFLAHVLDMLDEAVGGVTARAMFGGHGLYRDGIMFALIAYERLYFKADDANRDRFADAGSEPFTYEAAGRKPVTMSYWEAPEGSLDAPDDLREWALLGIEASKRAAKGKKGKK